MKREIHIATILFAVLLTACSALNQAVATPTPTSSPVNPLEAGWKAYKAKKLGPARDIAEKAIAEDGQNAEAWALLANVNKGEEDFGEAITNLEKAIDLGYSDPDAPKELEYLYLIHISFLLTEADISWSKDEIISNIVAAKEAANRVSQKDYEFTDFTKFFVYLLTREPQSGFEQGTSQEALDQLTLAEEHFTAEEWEEAIADYQASIDVDEDFAVAYVFMGDAYFSLEDYPNAITYYNKGLSLNDALYQGYSFMGDAYYRISLPLHAKKAFGNALILDPEYQIAVSGLEAVETNYGSWEEKYFNQFGYRLRYPSEGEFTEITDTLGDPKNSSGDVIYKNDALGFHITWMSIRNSDIPQDYDPMQIPLTLLEKIQETGEVEALGKTQEFGYNEVQITYQPFSFTAVNEGGAVNTDTGVMALWKCNNIVFTLDLRFFNIDSREIDPYSILLMNPYLESILCELEK